MVIDPLVPKVYNQLQFKSTIIICDVAAFYPVVWPPHCPEDNALKSELTLSVSALPEHLQQSQTHLRTSDPFLNIVFPARASCL